MELDTVLEYCARHGISLRLDDAGQVKVSGSRESLTPEVLDALRQHKASIAARLQSQDEVPVARSWSDGEGAPLSSMQRQMLALDERTGDSRHNHLVVAYHVEGDYRHARTEAALQALIQRHAILRSLFMSRDDVMLQEPMRLPVAHIHLPITLSDAVDPGVVDREVEAFATRRFDLARELPFRLLVHAAGSAGHGLTWVFHHVAVDGESIARILSEYAVHATAPAETGAPPALQYRDYAAWEQARREAAASAGLAYWVSLLRDARSPRFAGGDESRTWEDCFEQCSVSKERAHSLGALARHCRTSLHVLMEALFAWHLACHLDEKRVLYGTPVTLRNRTGLHEMIGPLVSTQLRYFEILPDECFVDFLVCCTEAIRDGLGHAEVPQDDIADACANDALRNVDAFFTLQMAPAQHTGTGSSQADPVRVPRMPPKFAYVLNALERRDDLLLRFEWDPRRIASSFMQGQAQSFSRLADAVLSNPRITLLDSQALLANGTLLIGPSTAHEASDILQLFSRTVELHADRIALEQGERTMRYHELDALSSRWAAGLGQRLTDSQTKTVAIAMPRCPEFFVAQLAVLRAGATFVPLDIDLPRDRTIDIIERSRAALVLVRDADEAIGHPRVIAVERLVDPTGTLDSPASASAAPAYMIFTSGTTGRPKGVLIGHRSLVNLATAQARIFDIAAGDRILQYSALGFDAQISEWSTAWCRGATLVLPSEPEQRTDASALAACLRDARITHVTLPPTVLASIDHPEDMPARVIIAAGEACPQELADRYARTRRFINAYGPTEGTVCTTTHLHETGWPISLGRPIDNMSVFVVDANRQPLPPGAEGELCIAGDGIAIGYFEDEEQTRQRFPVLSLAGSRMTCYLTGDRVRLDPDGSLVFIGRIDDEVKIRGNRVAPEEVTHHLLADERIAAACCIFDPSRQSLIAAVVLREFVQPADLRRHLAERLPRYMVPGRIVVLDALPLTANSKVDKSALAARVEASTDCADLLPDEPLAHALAEMWSSLLGASAIGLDSDFFALGGHSLLAARLKREVGERLGVTVDTESVFTHFQFGDFLAHVRSRLPADPGASEMEEMEW